MWKALENIAFLVKSNGILYVVIYNDEANKTMVASKKAILIGVIR
jgi:hypothetical protein